VAALALRFLKDFAARNRPDVSAFSRAAERALQEYDWPGNIRELRNAVMRAVALAAGPEVQVEDLPEALRKNAPQAAGEAEAPPPYGQPEIEEDGQPSTLALSTQEAEVRRILETLQQHNNNRLRAAAELGISRVALYKKLHKYGLMTPRYPKGEEPDQR
jgi:DNA-binding NtrC family response regulator